MRIFGSVLLQMRNKGVTAAWQLAICSVLILVSARAEQSSGKTKGRASSDLFKTTNLWTVHFHFTPDQWEAMPPDEPAEGFFGGGPGGPGGPRGGGPVRFGGGPGGPGGPGRPGAPGGPGGGFGPGMFLAPTFMAADANGDKKVSREEFTKFAEASFAKWDKNHNGTLKEEDLRDGLNSAIMTPGPGAGRGFGLNLQGSEGKRNGLASAAGIEFKYVKGDLQIGDQHLPDVGVRYKGNGTWMGSRLEKKRSMKVELNHFQKGQTFSGETKLNFHNCVTDASFMNEVLSHRLYRDAGVPAPRTAFARVYVDVPGKYKDEYFGLYSVIENVDSAFAESRFGTKKGAILKPVTRQPFEYAGEDWSKYNQTYDPKTHLSEEQKKRMIEFCKLVSQADDATFSAKLGDYLDLDNFSRYMAVTVWLSTLDSILGIGQNYYVYLHPKTGKINFMPWDLDHSFGQFPLMGSQEQREQLSMAKPWQGQNKFLERVFKTEAFQALYRARMEEFSKTIFQPDRFVKQVDELAAAVRPAVKDESEAKLERFDKVVAGEPVAMGGFGPPPGRDGPGRPGGPEGPGGRFGGPAGPGGPGGFMQPAKPIKGFVKARAQAVKDQLSGKDKGQTLDMGFAGPGIFMAGGFLAMLDADKNGALSRDEFMQGFNRWFKSWDKENTGSLTEEQVRAGLNETFRPPPGAGPGPGGPGRN
jgi:spore coat protein H